MNIVTYTSTDGTSPLANKVALREKLAEFTGMDLSGAAKTTLDSAVAVAVNPIATQTAVNEAITALENINTAGVPAVVAFEDFEGGADGVYNNFTYATTKNANYATIKTITNSSPVLNKAFGLLQASTGAKANNVIGAFTLKDALDYSNATEGQYAEISFDLNAQVSGTTLVMAMYDSAGTLLGQVNVGAADIRTGVGYTADTDKVGTYAQAGLSEGYDKNIKLVIDLKNHQTDALYVDGVRILDSTDAHNPITDIAFAESTVNNISKLTFNWENGTHTGNEYTFMIDNLGIVTYTSSNGTSPIANKAALRDRIDEEHKYVLSAADEQILAEAVATAINPVATQTDVDAAVTSLNGISAINGAEIIAFEDFEDGADGGYADFTYATTRNPDYATITTVTDPNPVLNKAFGFLQASTGAKANYVIGTFALKDVLDYSNATEGQYAEISFDLRTQVESSTLAMAMYDSNGTLLGQVNVGAADIRTGVGYTADTDKVGTYAQAGLSEGYDKNIRLIVDLKNHQTDAIYVDGVRILDSTDAHNPITDIDFAESTVNNIAQLRFNWCNGNSTGDEYTFLVDNLRVMTYNAESPENDKAALIKSIKANYVMADKGVLENAVSVYKNILASESEIESAVKGLYPAVSTYLSKIVVPQTDVYADKLIKTDLSKDDITVTYSSSPAGYIDENLNVTQPTEGSVDVTITYTLSRGDDTASTTKTVTVHPRAALEINNVIFTDATGAIVYGAQANGTLKSVNLTKHVDKAVKLYAAVYEDMRLKSVKIVDATDGEVNIDLPVTTNSDIKFFVWENETIEPLQGSRKIMKGAGTIHIIADSIYADYTKEDYAQYAPDYGIGQAFSAEFATTNVSVNNAAVPGTHTKGWYNDYMMDSILAQIKQGDYVIVSLCHNDKKVMTEDVYKTNIVRMINDIKEQGGVPILVTPVPRYTWTNGVLDTTHPFLQSMKDAASENNVLIYDLNAHLRELYTTNGATETSYEYFYSQAEGEALDRTHLSQTGAEYCSDWLIEQFKNSALSFVETSGN